MLYELIEETLRDGTIICIIFIRKGGERNANTGRNPNTERNIIT